MLPLVVFGRCDEEKFYRCGLGITSDCSRVLDECPDPALFCWILCCSLHEREAERGVLRIVEISTRYEGITRARLAPVPNVCFCYEPRGCIDLDLLACP